MQEKENYFVSENRYIVELKKFIGSKVIVEDLNGKKFKGVCLAIGFNHLNIILMTDKQKITIKNISNISRDRKKDWKSGEK